MSAFTIKTEVFEGPLDLLLSLIEKRKLFINDVSLAQVTDDYIRYVQEHPHIAIGDSAHFILIASTLLLIKSKSLLPTLDLTVEEQASVEDLEHRLKLYKRYQSLAKLLGGMFGQGIMFERRYVPSPLVVFAPHVSLTTANTLAALKGVIASIPKVAKLPEAVVRKVISLEEMIDRLTERVSQSVRMSFSQFASNAGGLGSGAGKGAPVTREQKVDIIVSFLAMLELVKNGAIRVSQAERFDEIEMESEEMGVPRYA